MYTLRPALLLASALALAACSDSPGTEPPPSGAPPQNGAEVPASATASTAAYFDYLNALPPNDRDPPLGVNSVSPPTSETEQPRSF